MIIVDLYGALAKLELDGFECDSEPIGEKFYIAVDLDGLPLYMENEQFQRWTVRRKQTNG